MGRAPAEAQNNALFQASFFVVLHFSVLHAAFKVLCPGALLHHRPVTCADTNTAQESKPLVQYQPRARKVAPAPSEVPIVHSSSYLLQEQEGTFQSSRKHPTARRDQDLDDTANAMEWALRRADAYFDKVEAESSEHSTVRVLVQNPATRATMKTMQVTIPYKMFQAGAVGWEHYYMCLFVLGSGVVLSIYMRKHDLHYSRSACP